VQRQAAQEPRECALMLRLQMAQVATSGSRLARAHKRKKSLPETKRPPTRFKLQFQPQTEWGGNPKTPGARDSRENSLSTRMILCAREGRLLTRSSFSRAATFFFNSASSPSLISLSLFFAGQPMKGPGRPSISGHDCADLGQYDYDFGHSPLTSIPFLSPLQTNPPQSPQSRFPREAARPGTNLSATPPLRSEGARAALCSYPASLRPEPPATRPCSSFAGTNPPIVAPAILISDASCSPAS
jgi:hypothetical protein